MEHLKKNKWFSWLLATLIIANLVTLGTFWFLKVKDTKAQSALKTGRDASVFIIKELGLTPKQQSAYKVLIEKHQGDTRRLRQQIGPLKDRFFNSISDTTLSKAELEQMAALIGEKEKDLDLATFNHFRDLRKLCTSSQKEKFDNMISQVMRMIAPAPPRPPAPPGGKDGRMPPPPPDGGMPPPPPGDDGMPPPPDFGQRPAPPQ